MAVPAPFFTGSIDPALTQDQGHNSREIGLRYPGSGTHGGQSPDLLDIVSNASAKTLESNGHFVRVKVIADQRATEIERLQEALTSKIKENDQLSKENERLNVEVRTLKEALGLFAKDHHNRQAGVDSGVVSITSEILDLPAKQALWIRADNPGVVYWVKKEYTRAARRKNRGETDGNATSVQVKRKRGRPPQDSNDEEDHSTHFYLETRDGIPVDKSVIAEMSRKARMLWRTLDKCGLAPETFGKIENRAWDYYSRTILADKAHDFLRLCDDGEWKLREWSTKSYPSWYRNRHMPATPKTENNSTDSDNDLDLSADHHNDPRKLLLEDPKLIRMNPHDDPQHEDDDDPDVGEHHTKNSDDDPSDSEHTKNNGDPDSDAEGVNDDPDARDSDQHTESGNKTTDSGADGPTTRGTAQSTSTSPMVSTAGVCSSTTSALVDPFAPTPSDSVSPSMGTGDAGDISNPANNTTPITTTGFRVKLKVRAPRNPLSVAVDKETPTPAPTTHGTTATSGTDPTGVSHNSGPPPDMPPPDSHVKAKTDKKRKPEGSNTATTTNKRQKLSNAAMAIPTEGNSIRNICMRRWNEQQPGGQGPLSEFDIYFKSLTDADKEPLKKELRIAQVTARKAKLSAKRANDTPSAN
ncbi:hypothetical protein H4582DRAFT_2189453 [Lactarius indigo]|nr:hypothetical protein H4582DRAFT_2189453 [Lactarius indigo]